VVQIDDRLDSSTLEVIERHAQYLENTESGTVLFSLRRPIAVDPYEENERLGRFVLSVDGIVRGGGTVREARAVRGSARVVRLDDRWEDTDHGSRIDLVNQSGLFEIEVSEGLRARLETGERVLMRLRGPEQMAPIIRYCFEQRLDFNFHRTTEGPIELLVYNSKPRARRGDGDFAI
jgi:bifunctional enzyme CysN/CysC/sulfate adenylyltransferase subunit 1